MFDIGAAELLVIIIVAVIVIGPKDLPLAMRVAGRWIGKVRRISAQFRSGIDAMVREAELEDMEKKWKAQNEEIMRRSAAMTEAEAGVPVMTGPPPIDTAPVEPPQAQPPMPQPPMTQPPALEPAQFQPPALEPPPIIRPAIVTIGGHAEDSPPNNEPILPARPHLSSDDV